MLSRAIRLSLSFAFFCRASAWNPTSYPFLPASTDVYKVRELVIHAQGKNKTILDVGCGNGFSTSSSQGSVGIDADKQKIRKARKLFPDKTFKRGVLSSLNPDEKFDVVTSMFYFHKIPQFLRKIIICNAIQIANERVVIMDISPEYNVPPEMFHKNPFLPDYLKNCRSDLKDFKETIIEDGVLNMWIYEPNQDLK
tara:strand:+ start:724 stop:1311 length:588 start_codon:yes stop_codon:yes gene_type:complete